MNNPQSPVSPVVKLLVRTWLTSVADVSNLVLYKLQKKSKNQFPTKITIIVFGKKDDEIKGYHRSPLNNL